MARIVNYNRATGKITSISGRTTLANARRLADQADAWHRITPSTTVSIVTA